LWSRFNFFDRFVSLWKLLAINKWISFKVSAQNKLISNIINKNSFNTFSFRWLFCWMKWWHLPFTGVLIQSQWSRALLKSFAIEANVVKVVSFTITLLKSYFISWSDKSFLMEAKKKVVFYLFCLKDVKWLIGLKDLMFISLVLSWNALLVIRISYYYFHKVCQKNIPVKNLLTYGL
jgi:hypothetical protein